MVLCGMEELHLFEELNAPVDIVGGLLWTLPMVISLATTISLTDRFPSLLKIKHLLQETLIPLLKETPSWVCIHSLKCLLLTGIVSSCAAGPNCPGNRGRDWGGGIL